MRAQRYDSAESHLLAAFGVLEGVPRVDAEETRQRFVGLLVELYTLWDRPDELQRWKARQN